MGPQFWGVGVQVPGTPAWIEATTVVEDLDPDARVVNEVGPLPAVVVVVVRTVPGRH